MARTVLPMDHTYAQVFMDELTAAVVTGDEGTYLRLTDFPFYSVAAPNTICVCDEEEGRAHLASITHMYKSLGIVTVDRHVNRLDMVTDDLCMVDYIVTLLTKGGARHCAPYRGISTLRRVESGEWKTVSTISSLQNKEWPMASPQPPMSAGLRH